MSKHLMIDIETFGKAPDGVIVSIGAVLFDSDPNVANDEFYVAITPIGQNRYKRELDADTCLWWMAPERQAAFLEWRETLKFDLAAALDGFGQWIALHGEIAGVWGNGSTFDNAILDRAFQSVGMETPWKFYADRCFRTVKNLAPKNLEPKRVGTHHNALDDARHQVNWLREIQLYNTALTL